MMKKPVLLLFSIISFVCVHAQQVDSLCVDSAALNQSMDSLAVDTAIFDNTLVNIDTLSCPRDTIIYDLPDSVYKARLQALPFLIEMPYNSVVRAFILRYVQRNPKTLARIQRKAEYYFPLFYDALGRNGLPYELCYLPVIESALNPQAHSHAGAAGLWQFMPSTARLYGLEVNSLVDERMDPIRSTEAACQFMKSLYSTFGDWTLALAAYNCGPGNVNKAIHRSGKRDFWSIYPYLPRETRSYVPIFIAAAYSINYADLHGICPEAIEMTTVTDTIQTQTRQHLLQISEILGIDLDELRRLNPQYARDVIPGGKTYALCLPADRVTDYIDQLDVILNYRADELINNRRAEIDLAQKTSLNGGYTINGVTYYKIKSGDTLGGIAQKFHVTVKQIKAWNGLKSDNIRAGATLKIGVR
ncbi:MAG: transglycosylase SLT domain-containing protein [Paludibacteraceae bacterium]|nr:transglycosylase SLT domain-containing protein [Paludibacteraceae bacterium]